jgi:uncharacterized protein (TIGR00730 family)
MRSVFICLRSDAGRDDALVERTIILAKTLVYNDYYVVYGGVEVGLMGMLASAALARRCRMAGIIPGAAVFAEPGVSLRSQRDGLRRTDGGDGPAGPAAVSSVADGRERRRRLVELSDAFTALPGGYGSLDEIFALLAGAQLGAHRRPLGFFAAADQRRRLERFLDRAEREGFIREEHRRLLAFEKDMDRLLKKLREITGTGRRRSFV